MPHSHTFARNREGNPNLVAPNPRNAIPVGIQMVDIEVEDVGHELMWTGPRIM